MAQIFIETPRLILRDWIESDYQPFIEMNKDERVMEFFPSTLTEEETMASITRIIDHITQAGYGLFAVERKDNHQFIGFTGFNTTRFESFFTPCVEIGWRYSYANWRNGFATEAATTCLNYGREALKLKAVYSFTSVLNKRSEGLMIKIGMEKQGFFDHPLLQSGHPLKQHVLYKI